MGIRSRAIGTAAVIWLAVLLLPAARADEFNFAFSANTAICPQITNSGSCADFGSGTFTTGPLTASPLYSPSGYPVLSITGMIDGFSVSMLNGSNGAVPGGVGVTGTATAILFSSGPITMTGNGQEWDFVRHDGVGPWSDFLYNTSTQALEPINLTITTPTITTPEPSTLLALCIGLLGLVVWFRNKLV